MSKACIFIGGAAPERSAYIHEIDKGDLIIAADSGYHTVTRDGLEADFVIGDGDSLQMEIGKSVRQLLHQEDKDETDTELALELAEERGFSPPNIILIGGGEGRIDHLLSIISCFRTEVHPIRWYTAKECIYYLSDKLVINSCPMGTMISVIGLDREPTRLHTEGLKWPLDHFEVSSARHSTSNENTSDHLLIEVIEGPPVLVTKSY